VAVKNAVSFVAKYVSAVDKADHRTAFQRTINISYHIVTAEKEELLNKN